MSRQAYFDCKRCPRSRACTRRFQCGGRRFLYLNTPPLDARCQRRRRCPPRPDHLDTRLQSAAEQMSAENGRYQARETRTLRAVAALPVFPALARVPNAAVAMTGTEIGAVGYSYRKNRTKGHEGDAMLSPDAHLQRTHAQVSVGGVQSYAASRSPQAQRIREKCISGSHILPETSCAARGNGVKPSNGRGRLPFVGFSRFPGVDIALPPQQQTASCLPSLQPVCANNAVTCRWWMLTSAARLPTALAEKRYCTRGVDVPLWLGPPSIMSLRFITLENTIQKREGARRWCLVSQQRPAARLPEQPE